MIFIDRSRATAPDALLANGVADLPRIAQLREERRLTSDDFNSAIYGTDEVRTALRDMQYAKCCYCEHKYEGSFNTVEHFRPKAKAKTASGREQWGYWWLAYEFDNFYFCCKICNNFKSTWFPIGGRNRRYRPEELPRHVSYLEPALIVDPGFERPERHLTYVRDPTTGAWRIAPLDRRGAWTIRAARLDRDDLTGFRDDHVRDILMHVVRVADRSFAARLVMDHMPYALLSRCVLRHHGLV